MSQPSASTLDSTTRALVADDHSISHLWTIKNFKQFHRKVEKNMFTSSVFKDYTHPEYKWNLQWYIKWSSKPELNDYFGVHLSLLTTTTADVLAEVKFSLLDAEHKEDNVLKFSKVFNSHNKADIWAYSKYTSKKKLLYPNPSEKLFIDDTLKIFFELKFAPKNSATTETVQLQGRGFADVTFSVDGKSFDAHKRVLAAQSPVFATMFKQDMRENKHSTVNISDISRKTFANFLKYFYTEKISTKDAEMARNLFIAADKYGVDGLKAVCEPILWEDLAKDLSVENVISFLILADKFRAKELKKQVAFYIKIHPSIMTTQRWKCEILARPHLFDYVKSVVVEPDPDDEFFCLLFIALFYVVVFIFLLFNFQNLR